MSKGLEELERLKSIASIEVGKPRYKNITYRIEQNHNSSVNKSVEIIERELKVLEILKEHIAITGNGNYMLFPIIKGNSNEGKIVKQWLDGFNDLKETSDYDNFDVRR